ncbi:PfkB family carbohydrate kinase [Streptomyces sp.]|uniref:PfkB family carbohydrate kinase n=1 Tax=Streptomyces sp. TaxID=1931 RepID=UPI002F40060C
MTAAATVLTDGTPAPTDVVVMGEVLVDLVWRTNATSVAPLAGGSPANVAVGLHRLDRSVSLVSCWGEDPPGAVVAEYLHGIGVPVDRAESASSRTTLALAYVDDATGGATYDFLAAWDPLRLAVPPEATLLHTGSLAIVVEPGAERVREACREMRARPGGTVAVDLNIRPGVQPDRAVYRTAVERVVAVADVVKASEEDLTWLWPDLSTAEAARGLLAMGPRLVVTTLGAEGAAAYIPDAEVTMPAPKVDVVDTIGAGDAFQSALLAALLFSDGSDGTPTVRLPADADSLRDVLRQAVVAGALTCEQAGARPPTRAQLDAALTTTFA